MLSRLVITFLPRSKRLLISWLQSPSVVILEPRKIKSDTVSTVSLSISHEVMGPDAMIFVFWMLSLSQLFHSPLSSRGFLVPLYFLPYLDICIHIFFHQYTIILPSGNLRKVIIEIDCQKLLSRKWPVISREGFWWILTWLSPALTSPSGSRKRRLGMTT